MAKTHMEVSWMIIPAIISCVPFAVLVRVYRASLRSCRTADGLNDDGDEIKICKDYEVEPG
jgi:hypothetical protein